MFVQSATSPFLPKTNFEPFVQFPFFCTFKPLVAKTETKLSAIEKTDMTNSDITYCLASLFLPNMHYSSLARKKTYQ